MYRIKSVICLILWRRYVFVYDGPEDHEFDVVLLTYDFISNLLQYLTYKVTPTYFYHLSWPSAGSTKQTKIIL